MLELGSSYTDKVTFAPIAPIEIAPKYGQIATVVKQFLYTHFQMQPVYTLVIFDIQVYMIYNAVFSCSASFSQAHFVKQKQTFSFNASHTKSLKSRVVDQCNLIARTVQDLTVQSPYCLGSHLYCLMESICFAIKSIIIYNEIRLQTFNLINRKT